MTVYRMESFHSQESSTMILTEYIFRLLRSSAKCIKYKIEWNKPTNSKANQDILIKKIATRGAHFTKKRKKPQ